MFPIIASLAGVIVIVIALVQARPREAPPTADSAPIVEVSVVASEWPPGGPTWRELLDNYGLEQDSLLGATLAANRGAAGCPNADTRIAPGGPPVKIVLEDRGEPSGCSGR